jgi:alanine racemase
VSQVRKITKGESVGYNREFKAKEDMTIGVVPFGYADGLDRRLGNGIGKLFVNHRMCDILGNISMDSCCINITNTDTKEGDLVEIFGENIVIEDIAKLIGTTSYEFLSKINRRIKRVYI